MVKAWHVVALVGFAIFLSVIAALESGVVLTPYYFYPLIIVIVVGFVAFLIYKLLYKKESPFKMYRGKLTIEQAKHVAAMHLLNHHGIDVFATDYSSNPESAKYIVNMIANRCSPVEGEEAWFVRLAMKDHRYFDGLFTKIIIYMDGEGNVTDDPVMNDLTFIDNELWRKPQIWFTQPPSKTAKPRSLQQMLAQRYEETGELPPTFLRGPEKDE